MSENYAIQDLSRGRFEAKHQVQPSRRIIATDVSNLRLVALTPEDADAYYALVDRNRTHLTQHGDWQDLGEATPASVHADLVHLEDLDTYFGIWLDEQLIGRVDLNPRDEGNVVLAYWLGGEVTGKGYATAACRALIAYGKVALGATTIWAGVTRGNVKSEALLARLGFHAVSDQGSYPRFRLPLS
jgi:ribosomal-protein-serine acetyltransferase